MTQKTTSTRSTQSRKTKTRKPSKRTSTRRKRRTRGKVLRWVLVLLGLMLAVVAYFLWPRGGGEAVQGIDVSHHQGVIRWQKVAAEGKIQFAYLKATDGLTYTDPLYQRNLREARAAGLAVGAYHFFRVNQPGEEQFRHFARVVGRNFDLLPMLDLEPDGGKVSDRKEYRKQVAAFVQCCRTTYGVSPVIYSSHVYYRDYVKAAVADCPYWIAWYPSGNRRIGFMQRLLSHWNDRRRLLDARHPGHGAVMWQYSKRGSIPGIQGDVDCNDCWNLEALRYRPSSK